METHTTHTHPVGREQPAALGGGSQGIDGPTRGATHYMGGAVVDRVLHLKPSQLLNDGDHHLLVPGEGGDSEATCMRPASQV